MRILSIGAYGIIADDTGLFEMPCKRQPRPRMIHTSQSESKVIKVWPKR